MTPFPLFTSGADCSSSDTPDSGGIWNVRTTCWLRISLRTWTWEAP